MKTITLFTSNEDVELKQFAGGECNIRFSEQIKGIERVRLHTRLNSSNDIMNLCLAVDALRRIEVTQIEVFVPYVPYARQDRVMVPGESLSIKVLREFVKQLAAGQGDCF